MKNNVTISKPVNVDDSLYEKIKQLSLEKYSSTISEIINIAVEEYIERNKYIELFDFTLFFISVNRFVNNVAINAIVETRCWPSINFSILDGTACISTG